jgi:hypothetical protein
MSDWTDDETISDTDCVDSAGFVWPEHDYSIGMNPITCNRCGAETHYDSDDAGAVTNDLVFKALATFVFGGMLYLTYWTAAHMRVTEFLLLTLFDIFVFLSWSRAYAHTMIHVCDSRPEPTEDDPGEI